MSVRWIRAITVFLGIAVLALATVIQRQYAHEKLPLTNGSVGTKESIIKSSESSVQADLPALSNLNSRDFERSL